MRSFKKLFAVLLTVAMILSMVSISVFASDYKVNYKILDSNSNEITATKAGKTVTVKIYGTPGEYANLSLTFETQIDVTKDNISTTATLAYANSKYFSLNFDSAITVASDTVLASVNITIPESVTGSTAELLNCTDSFYTIGSDMGTYDADVKATVGITPSFTATSAKAVKDSADVTAPVEVALGTTADKALEGITATVSDGTNSESGYTVSNWVSTPAYDATKTGEYEFKGDVDISGDNAANKGTLSKAVKVTVKVVPITDGTVAEAKGNVMENPENGITEDAIKAVLPTEIAVTKGDFTDTFTVTWNTVEGYSDKNDGKGYVAGDEITVKGTLTSPSKNGLFTTTTTDINGKVTVVPAEIKGGAISVKNPIDNGYATVTITVPVAEIAKMPLDAEGDSDEVKAENEAKRTITVSIDGTGDKASEKGVGTYVVSPEEIAAAKAEGAADLNVQIKTDKKMKDLGYSSSGTKAFTVDVTVGGTKLLNGESKDAVTGEVKKATNSAAGGINKGSSTTTTTYAVTVAETTNGTVTVSPEKAAKDATVTITATPADGYKVKTVTVTKADGTNVSVDEKALTFTMPASAVNVAVEFEEGTTEPSVDPTPADDKFADVADDFWAAKDIYTLKDAGIIGGKSATEFDPNGDVTRAEFAKMVVGLFGYKATSDSVSFEDCKAEDWFTPYVAAGVEAGVIKGVSDTEFAPNATITREDACTILGRALNKVAESNELKFTDAESVAEYAAPYVALLSELGYVNGYEDGSFLPQNNITRAEAAKIIAAIYNANATVTEDNTDAAVEEDAVVEEDAAVEEDATDAESEK